VKRYEGNFDTLPKWARTEITVLEMRLDEANKRNRRIEAGETNTRIYHWNQENEYLPNSAHIEFVLDAHREITAYMNNGTLHISSGAGCLVITPVASNVIDVTSTR